METQSRTSVDFNPNCPILQQVSISESKYSTQPWPQGKLPMASQSKSKPEKMLFQVKECSHPLFRESWHKCILILRFYNEICLMCFFFHKWNEHWPAWLHIDNKIIPKCRRAHRYCQRWLDVRSRLFELSISALKFSLLFTSASLYLVVNDWVEEE